MIHCRHRLKVLTSHSGHDIHRCDKFECSVTLVKDAIHAANGFMRSCDGCNVPHDERASEESLESSPLVSCIMATYNLPERLESLEEAVESFLRQDYPNRELILICDSVGQIVEFSHPKVTVINSPTRFASCGDKLNAAIAASRGELICRLDDDDLMLPDRISQQVSAMQKGFDVVTPGSIWWMSGQTLEWQTQRGWGHVQGMFRRSVFDAAGGYHSGFGEEDGVLHGKLLNTRFLMLPGDIKHATYIYKWADGLQHISGFGSVDNMRTAYEKNGSKGTPGTYKLNPHWNRDYVSLTKVANGGKITVPNAIVSKVGEPIRKAKICVIGFPSRYGGADTELDHQITCWRAMGVEVHVIPTSEPDSGQLSLKVAERGCVIHKAKDWSACKGMHVISYCNGDFLANLAEIKKHARSTTFVNCMTWIFQKEKEAHAAGLIDFSLYQTDHARDKVEAELTLVNPKFRWAKVKPFFDHSAFPFIGHSVDDPEFHFCRVSRDDPAKFSKETMRIFREFETPVSKKGTILGITEKVYEKTGLAPDFVDCVAPGGKPAAEVYADSHCLIQSCDTYENLPRVGMEAMSSGCVPIVDNRGGWKEIIEHGVSGFLCGSADEFIEKATRLASDPAERGRMAIAGRKRIEDLYGFESASKEWAEFFAMLETVPEKEIVMTAKKEPVGTKLKELFAELGVHPPTSCHCTAWINQMNTWGIDGCHENRGAILGHLTDASRKVGWLQMAKVGLRGYLTTASLLDKAIAMASQS